jgi:hypothetical protein
MPEIWTQRRKFTQEPVLAGTENYHQGERHTDMTVKPTFEKNDVPPNLEQDLQMADFIEHGAHQSAEAHS